MANGYVPLPHFFHNPNPNPIHVPDLHPPKRNHQKAPSTQAEPERETYYEPNNAHFHLPPNHQHPHFEALDISDSGPGEAYPAPNAGGQWYASGVNDHGHLFSWGRANDALEHHPYGRPDGPNIIPRFLAGMLARVFVVLGNICEALKRTGTAILDQDTRTALPTLFQDLPYLQALTLSHSWSLLIGLIVVVVVCVAAWFGSPKGENITIWRSTLILSAASCYIMWAIVFLAQWHPLIEPKMSKLRPGYVGGS